MGNTLSRHLSTAVATVGIGVLGLLAVGCGPVTPAANTTTGPTTLTIWQDSMKQESMDAIASSISTDTTKVTSLRVDPTKYEWLSLNKMAAETGPDVWMIPNDYLQDHRDKVVTLPNTWITADPKVPTSPKDTPTYFQQYYDFLVKDTLTTDGALGFPGPIMPLKLFINTKLFGDANQRWQNALTGQNDGPRRDSIQKTLSNPITTWDQFVAASQLITQKNGNSITVSGAALGTASNIPHADDVMQLLTMQQGGKIVDATKLIALFQNYIKASDGTIKYPGMDALKFYVTFANTGNANYSWNASMGDAETAFLQGKVAMLFDYGDFEDTIKQHPNDNVTLKVADVPQLTADATPVGFFKYTIFTIPKGSPNRTKGALVARQLTEKYMTTALQAMPEAISPIKVKESEATTDEKPLFTAQSVFKKSHTQFDQLYKDMIDDVSQRGQSVENSVNNAADKITTLLQAPSGY